VDGECTETLVNGATREHRDFPFGLLLSDRNRDASKMSQELMQKYVQKQELTILCRDIDLSVRKSRRKHGKEMFLATANFD